MSNQSGRQAAVRAITGATSGTYEQNFMEMFDADGIASGPFNQRLLAWLNEYLEATHTTLAGAQHAFALAQGVANWNSLNTWDSLVSYDADAQAYITATGTLFPDAVNDLVLAIKAADAWDNDIGFIKLAVGVPDRTASLVDLRNTAFTGTAFNNPTHSATEGWGFTAASSQYIDTGWDGAATGSKASQNSIHVGMGIGAATTSLVPGTASDVGNSNQVGILTLGASSQSFNANDNAANALATAASGAAGRWIITRTGASARKAYKNGSGAGNDTQASTGMTAQNLYLGAANTNGTAGFFWSGRTHYVHGGGALSDAKAAAIDAAFAAYVTAVGGA